MPGLTFFDMTRPWSPVWLFVGDFSGQNRRERYRLAGESLAKMMNLIAPSVTIALPTALCALASTTSDAQPRRPRDLSAAWLERNVAPLGELMAIVDEIRAATLTASRLSTRLRTVVGEAPIVLAVEEILRPSGEGGSNEIESDAIDALFARSAGIAGQSRTAASPLDHFIGELIRGARKQNPDEALAQAGAFIESVVREVVSEIWSDSPLTRIVANWKGLRLVLGESTTGHPVNVELLDVQGEWLDALRTLLAENKGRPDAIFIADCVPSITAEQIASIGLLAQEFSVPTIFSCCPDLLWSSTPDERQVQEWDALRRIEGSNWLACVANEIALSEASEYFGEARSVVWGSPVFGFAARLTASFGVNGGFALVSDLGLGVSSPASHPAKNDPDHAVGTRMRTRIADFDRAHDLGMILLGEGKHASQLHVTSTTTLGLGAADLPTALILGRARRVVESARAGWPIDGSDERLALVLHRALENEVFPSGGVRINAQAHREIDPPIMRVEIDLAPPWLTRQRNLVCEFELPKRA
jgi:hypothetical protein